MMYVVLVPMIISSILYLRMMITNTWVNRDRLVYAVWLSFVSNILSIFCQFAAAHSLGETNKSLVKATNAAYTGNLDAKVIPRFNDSPTEVVINTVISLLWTYYMYTIVRRYAS